MANKPIIGLQDTLPEGEFHLPVCIDKADLDELLSDLQYAFLRQGKTTTNAYNRILNALAYLDDPQNAPCNECADYGGCQEVPALWSTVDYAPNDPRNPEEPVPPNYIDKPWYTITPGTLSPYQPGDVVTDITKIPSLLDLVGLITETGLPTITIHADGAGEVEIELLKIPTGGYCMITVDDNPLTAQFIPCNSLSISPTKTWWLDAFNEILEGDLFAAEKHEVRLEGSGAHVIRLVALPEIGGETIIGFGFGLRSVTYCGFPDVCEECEEMNCADVLACLDDVPAWQAINEPPAEIDMTPAEIGAFSDEQHTVRDTAYDGTPVSILSSANDNTSRYLNNIAFEEALTAWVVACFEAKLNQMRQIEGLAIIANLLLSFASYLGGGGWLIKGWGWSFLTGTMYASYGYNELWNALQDRENIRYTVGALMEAFNHSAVRDISFTTFPNVPLYGSAGRWAYGDCPIIRDWMRDEIFQHPLTSEKNYLLLLQAIHTANYHKAEQGDPMWRAWLDNWTMYRGKDYSTVGVNMIDGTISTATGFNYAMTSQYGYLSFTLNTPVKSKIDNFLFQLRSGTSANRTGNVKIKNGGAIVAENTWGGFVTGENYGGLNGLEYDGIIYTAQVNWGAGNAPASWDNNGHVRLNGKGQPPVGYWTPD